MHITHIGNEHLLKNYNNQDSFLESGRIMMVVDGCSGGKTSEVGARLFVQLFEMQQDFDNVDKFEKNVEKVLKNMLNIIGMQSKEDLTLKQWEFISNNYFFTIIACFKQETGFVVKALGDGFILLQNRQDVISYIKLTNGKYPQYIMYNYLSDKYKGEDFHETLEFKTYRFSKEFFKNAGVATDGLTPIADVLSYYNNSTKIKERLNAFLINADKIEENLSHNRLLNIVKRNEEIFYDDITIVFSEEDK